MAAINMLARKLALRVCACGGACAAVRVGKKKEKRGKTFFLQLPLLLASVFHLFEGEQRQTIMASRGGSAAPSSSSSSVLPDWRTFCFFTMFTKACH
jgi:hypothetical protein